VLFSGRNICPGECVDLGGKDAGVPCWLVLCVCMRRSGMLGDGSILVDGRVLGDDL
jgi:hypothetical protein